MSILSLLLFPLTLSALCLSSEWRSDSITAIMSTLRAPMQRCKDPIGSALASHLLLELRSSSTAAAQSSYLLAIEGSLFHQPTLRSQCSALKSMKSPFSLATLPISSRILMEDAGRKYAARSLPAFVAKSTYTVTSFTLMLLIQALEFKKGRLENLNWKRDGCASCSGNSNFVCLNNQDCAIRTNNYKNRCDNVDCSLGIQLTFSGTDNHESVFNSWYEVKNLRQYSLYGLYSNLRNSLTDQYNKFF